MFVRTVSRMSLQHHSRCSVLCAKRSSAAFALSSSLLPQQQQRNFSFSTVSALFKPQAASISSEDSTTLENVNPKELKNESMAEINAQQHQQGKSTMTERAIREISAKLYLKNHIPLAQSSLRQYGAPYTDTKELESAAHMINHPEEDLVDKSTSNLMKFLRVFVHWFFREKYLHHAVVLETVAAVPGMVAGMTRHFNSLRRMERDHGKIGLLLEEAENERMHLLIWMSVTQPTFLERMLVIAAQFVWTTFYSASYIISPRWCHRLVGYLEQEAYYQYTLLLDALDKGLIPNRPAPDIARFYYNLPPDATLRDVVLCVRTDEAAHRDFNHELSDKMKFGAHSVV